jgi:RNA polymerase sigma-70 factor (ECF subfamily)
MDQELVARAQKGDRRAFETLAISSHPRLHKVAHGILRDPALAEDVTQQALLDIWRHLASLRDPARFEGWSYRILVNACHAEAKRTPRWLPDSELPLSREPRAGDAFGQVEDRDQLERGFSQLSVDHRAVLVLHYLLDMTQEQVAEILDVPTGTVASRLHRATRQMREALDAGTAQAASAQATTGAMR